MPEVEFPRTLERIDYELDDEFTRGVQLTIEHSGERVLDIARGDNGAGGELLPTTVFRVYCTAKPILAVAIARLVESGAVDLDAPLDARWPSYASVSGGVTARQLLTHTAGVHNCHGLEIELLTPEGRRAKVEGLTKPVAWRLGTDAGYSEAAAWHLLGWLVEDVTGEDLRAHLRANVLDPLELSATWIGMTPEEFEATLPSIGLNIDVRARAGFPMLFERSPRVCCTTNAAFGGLSTARDLARFYTALLQQLHGASIAALPSSDMLALCCGPARPRVYDQVLDRECTFGLGFMTALADHAFSSECSPRSFGHSGYAGSSFAFADPEYDVAVAVIFNGIVGHESSFMRRRALIRALYADLVSAREEVAPADAETRRRRWSKRRHNAAAGST
jgi:CubicO group peptidase (beta-lactamase class C family)